MLSDTSNHSVQRADSPPDNPADYRCQHSPALHTVAQGAIDFAVVGFAFVVLRLAYADAELDFGKTLGEVNLQRRGYDWGG